MASSRLGTDASYWPTPSTIHQPHQHSRVFIGPLLDHPTASSSKAGSLPSTTGKTSAHQRYVSGEVEEGDDYHTNERKRDVVRRQKRKVLQRRRASSGAAWGDEDDGDEDDDKEHHLRDGQRKLKKWVNEARGKEGQHGVRQPSEEEQALVATIMAPVRDEDADGGRGWWKVRWEGDRRRMSISSSIGPVGTKEHQQHPLRDALHASSSTGSTTVVSPRLVLPTGLFTSSPENSTSSLPSTRPTPYLLDPRNQIRQPHPSRRASENSVDTFYSARTDLNSLASGPGQISSDDLLAIPTPSNSFTKPSFSFDPKPHSFPSSAPAKRVETTLLPKIIHTEASPTGSTSSFKHYPNLPSPTSSSPLKPAMRRPTMPILKGPTTTPSPLGTQTQTVHFPVTANPSISNLLSDLRTRTQGRERAIEDRAEVIMSDRRPVFEGDGAPADPETVLNRQGGTGVEGNGSPLTAMDIEAEDDEELRVGDVVLRDRMLVKKQWSRSSDLPPGYNQQTQRKIPVDRSESWEERLVVLKKGRVEIYEDWAFPLQEHFKGTKKLVHVIYLQRETSVSLYSPTDLTFCLLTPPTSLKDARTTRNPSGIKSRMPRLTRAGTSVFIFKIKSRTRAIDWMWELYNQLHGSTSLPRYLDVHVPAFNNARVRIRVPVVGEDPGFDSIESVLQRLTRKQVIKHCARILSEVEGFRTLMIECGALPAGDDGDARLKEDDVDKHLALAWRHGERLDWIWADHDVAGKERNWNVLAGAGPLQNLLRPPKLELRLARHTASVLHLKSGTRVTEPPAVEGYIKRVRIKTQAKTLTYLTTHDGCIFICSPSKSHPPIPPKSVNAGRDANGRRRSVDEMPATEREFKRSERIRAIQQILGSNAFVDFRDVVEITRATTLEVRKPRRSSASGRSRPRSGQEDEEDDDGWESLSEDEKDEGGEEGLKAVAGEGQKTLQGRRQVLIRCRNGETTHFEAHSALIAREWIDRLNSLRIYWTEKHIEEAKQEMAVARSSQIHMPYQIPGQKQRQWDDDGEIEDPDDPPPYIEEFWNWCVLDECRPIVKAGRLFSKRKHWQFRAKYNILVHGHLVQFSLDLNRPVHARSHRFFLIDAYVYTGYLAQEGLPPSSNEDAYLGKGEPRRYADGFQTADGAEDTILVIWYRPHFTTTDANKYQARAQQDAQYIPPNLGKAGHQKLVLRARSKLERDSWAWAINLEIERLARRRKEREDRIRAAGNVL